MMSSQQHLDGKMNECSINSNNGKVVCSPSLKINKDSHYIRKSPSSNSVSPSSSSSSTTSKLANAVAPVGSSKPPQRHPVIIYTHSPKVIHTQPKDFMALVQKLTGMPRSDEEASPKSGDGDENNKRSKAVVNDDNESSSVVTEENCSGGGSSGVVEGQVNSCFGTPIFDAPPPLPPPQVANSYLTNIPVYRPNSTEFLCSNQPFLNYDDSFLYGTPNIHSLSSGINDFCDYGEF